MKRPSLVLTFLIAALAIPATTFLHEAGHWLAAKAFGFPDVRMQALSVDYALAGTTESQRAVVTLAGLAVTWFLTILFGWFCLRKPHPAWAALTIAAPLRGWFWMLGLIAMSYGYVVREGDEPLFAKLLHLPMMPFALLSLGLAVGSLGLAVWTLRSVPKGERWRWVSPIGCGLLLGVVGMMILAK